MLNKLCGFINWGNSIRMFSIFLYPSAMLRISVGLFLTLSLFIWFNILDDLSQIVFSISKSLGVIFTQLLLSINLGKVIGNSLIKVIDNSIACWFFDSSDFIVVILICSKTSNNLIQEEVNFIRGSLWLNLYLDKGKQSVTKLIWVNLGQDSLSVLEWCNQTYQQNWDKNLVHFLDRKSVV